MIEKMKLEHIGIMVHDFKKSAKVYQELLGLQLVDVEEVNVEGEQGTVGFLPVGDIKLELISSPQTSGMVADFLRDKGEGIHHLAFEVDDIDTYYEKLKENGVKFLWAGGIKTGSRNSRVFFFEPKEFNGIYIEILQKEHSHHSE
ncbi:UNVERIFIED_CONTAM: methylmalonyl-CoA/ethylmalonyl-CoA epimerase [Brevibacillus sp. OAP136]